jgi:hypothetical protein
MPFPMQFRTLRRRVGQPAGGLLTGGLLTEGPLTEGVLTEGDPI